MFKSFIAASTAISLLIITATPSFAGRFDRDDTGKTLFGMAAIGALSIEIERTQRRGGIDTSPRSRPAAGGIDRNRGWSGLNSRGGVDHRALPHGCLRRVETWAGRQRLFDQRCLERRYHHVHRLPNRCIVQTYRGRGPHLGFDLLCLHEHGFYSHRRR